MPASARVPDLAREVSLTVEVHGVGEMSLPVVGEQPAVGEPDAHSAPRSGTESGSTLWSG